MANAERRAGAMVICSATTVAEARVARRAGCDAIIAQGPRRAVTAGCSSTTDIDAQVGTIALVPQVVDAVDVPVIAAGGIADASRRGRRFAARSGRGPGRDGVPVLPGGADQLPMHRRGSAEGRARRRHGAHQRVHRPPGAQPRQPPVREAPSFGQFFNPLERSIGFVFGRAQ